MRGEAGTTCYNVQAYGEIKPNSLSLSMLSLVLGFSTDVKAVRQIESVGCAMMSSGNDGVSAFLFSVICFIMETARVKG